MHHLDWQRYAAHTLLALGVSGLLLALLARFSLASADTSLLPRMVEIVTSISAISLLLYLAAIGARTVFQALRYRLILSATEDSVPGFFHLLLVTASRNMFVDMLPARLGELSYVAMLNRGYRVGLPACLSSLAISFAFDLAALGLIIAAIVVHQLFSLGVEPWVIGTLVMVGLVFAFLLVLLFPGLRWATRLIEPLVLRLPGAAGRLTARLGAFCAKLAGVLEQTRAAGILGRLLARRPTPRRAALTSLAGCIALIGLFLVARFGHADSSTLVHGGLAAISLLSAAAVATADGFTAPTYVYDGVAMWNDAVGAAITSASEAHGLTMLDDVGLGTFRSLLGPAEPADDGRLNVLIVGDSTGFSFTEGLARASADVFDVVSAAVAACPLVRAALVSPAPGVDTATDNCRSFDTDWRFSTEHSLRIVRHLESNRLPVTFRELKSAYGHDSFLLADPAYHATLKAYFDRALEDA